jgi:hypothetical protein
VAAAELGGWGRIQLASGHVACAGESTAAQATATVSFTTEWVSGPESFSAHPRQPAPAGAATGPLSFWSVRFLTVRR